MNVALCREAGFINPFQYRERTKERGQAWDTIAVNLQKHGFNVTKRSVRDRYKLLKEQVLKRNREEAKASGIAPELTGAEAEVIEVIEDLLEVENDTKGQQAEIQLDEKKKELDGVEMRKRCLETFSETNKRYY